MIRVAISDTISDAHDWLIFQVERALSKLFRVKVVARKHHHDVMFTLDYRWEFQIDLDDLNNLAKDIDNMTVFEERFNTLIPTSLRLNPMR